MAKSQKSYKDAYVFSSSKVCTICMYCAWLLSYSKRHLRKLFLQLWAALFHGWVNFTPLLLLSDKPGCDIPGAHLQGSKTGNRQDIPAAPQLIFAVVICAVPGLSVFYSFVASILQSWVCTIRGVHLLGSTARIQRDIRSDCFCSCKLRCCRAECVLLLDFNVQSDIFAVMIGRSVECIRRLHVEWYALCQKTSPKRIWNVNLTSQCDVTNNTHPATMTTICDWRKSARIWQC